MDQAWAIGPVLHVDETWAAARYHAGAKNRRLAAEFGREAFEVLSWAEGEPSLAPRLRKIKGPALASAHRLNARYLVDAGRPREALGAWMRALAIHPRTALARMNILGSAILEVLGLGAIRESILRRRKRGLAP